MDFDFSDRLESEEEESEKPANIRETLVKIVSKGDHIKTKTRLNYINSLAKQHYDLQNRNRKEPESAAAAADHGLKFKEVLLW